MGAVPIMHTWATGEIVTAGTAAAANSPSLGSQVQYPATFLLSPPHCQVTALNSQLSIPNTTTPQLITGWDTATIMNDSQWSSGNSSRLVCNTPGFYQIDLFIHYPITISNCGFMVGMALNSGGSSWGSANQIAIDTQASMAGSTGVGQSVLCSWMLTMNSGDYVEGYTAQNTGGSQSPSLGIFGASFSMRFRSSS
jgi:hypothetical protein